MGDHDRNLENYSKAIRRNSDLARVELKKIFDRFKNASAEDVRDAVFLAMPGLVERFGEISVNAALEYYGAERSLITSSHYRPFRGIRVSKREIERTIRFHAGKLFEGDTTGFTSALFDELDRWVLESGRRALIATSERDQACTGWARIPSGSKTCAFCYMLASRGFAYKSADSAGLETKFHTKCDCRVVPEFNGKTPEYRGYDPVSMREVYKAAHKKGDSASDVLQRMRWMNPDLFTDGVGYGGRSAGEGRGRSFRIAKPKGSAYKSFKSNKVAVEWAKKHLSFPSTLVSDQQAARRYTTLDYLDWNESLRRAKGGIPEAFFEETKALDGLLDKSRLPESLVLHRGTTGLEFQIDGIPLPRELTDLDLKRLLGTEQMSFSYTSTSIGVTSAFASKPVQIHFNVPAGVPALNMMEHSLYGDSEREILLKRGLRYRIDNIERNKIDGAIHVYATVIP